MAVSRVQVVSVPVSDQDRARDFYVDALGFVVIADQHMSEEMRWVMVAPSGGASAALTLVTWFPSMPAGSLRGLVLETEDLDTVAAGLRDRGIDVGESEDAPWGRYVQLTDPDGNGIILQESSATPTA